MSLNSLFSATPGSRRGRAARSNAARRTGSSAACRAIDPAARAPVGRPAPARAAPIASRARVFAIAPSVLRRRRARRPPRGSRLRRRPRTPRARCRAASPAPARARPRRRRRARRPASAAGSISFATAARRTRDVVVFARRGDDQTRARRAEAPRRTASRTAGSGCFWRDCVRNRSSSVMSVPSSVRRARPCRRPCDATPCDLRLSMSRMRPSRPM